MSAPANESFAVRPHLERLLAGQTLDSASARAVMEAVLDNRIGVISLSAFLMALRAKGESETELTAFARVLRERCIKVHAPVGALDTCGTGGDLSNTFNISTGAALVAAGMGIPVAKHGNRSQTSSSGSADVLKALGVNVDAAPPVVERCLAEANVAFLFAPLYHPGLKHALPVRRELAVRTVFNLIGPLSNPAAATHQLVGVPEPRWCEIFVRTLKNLGSEAAMAVCGELPGNGFLDEVSTWGPTTIARLNRGRISVERFDVAALGLPRPAADALKVSSPAESAGKLRDVLDGKPGPARDVVLLNATAAALAAGKAPGWAEGMKLAADSIDSGRAKQALENLVRISNAS